jgi:hypothetical protein
MSDRFKAAVIDDLRVLIHEVSERFPGSMSEEEFVERIAAITPEHELRDMYKAALYFAIPAILDEDLSGALKAVFGKGQAK